MKRKGPLEISFDQVRDRIVKLAFRALDSIALTGRLVVKMVAGVAA